MVRTRRKNKSGDEIRWVEAGFFNRVVIMLAGYKERTVTTKCYGWSSGYESLEMDG